MDQPTYTNRGAWYGLKVAKACARKLPNPHALWTPKRCKCGHRRHADRECGIDGCGCHEYMRPDQSLTDMCICGHPLGWHIYGYCVHPNPQLIPGQPFQCECIKYTQA